MTEHALAYEPQNSMVLVKLVDGKIDLHIYLSSDCDFSETLYAVMETWIEDESKPVCIAPHFTVAAIVDYFENYKMPHRGNHLEENIKPTVDALRAELEAQIKRIDAFTYAPVGKPY